MAEEYQRETAALNTALPDPGAAGSVAGLLQGIKASPIIITGVCDTGMTASTTTIVSDDLDGYGDDYFNNNWFLMVVKNANSIGAAPSGETREITDYVSATGTFTCTAFSANVEASDEIVLIHRKISGLKYQEYTTGSGNWTCPANIFEVDVFLVSGGGGSGGVWCAAPYYGATGGGGGGAIGYFTDIPVEPGETYAYSVGAGGTAGTTAPSSGGTGGSTSFKGLTLVGGNGSPGRNSASSSGVTAGADGAACKTASGGSGGAATGAVGEVGVADHYAGSAIGLHSGAGGGGANASGTGGAGGATYYASGGTVTSNVKAGAGGASFRNGAVTNETTGIGVAGGDNTGAGASGSYSNNDSDYNGAAGGSGYILIMWRE